MRRGPEWWLTALAVLGLLSGCELAEIVTADAQDVLVVEAYLRAGEPVQQVLVHRTLDGRRVGGDDAAEVRLEREGAAPIVLQPDPELGCLEVSPGFVGDGGLEIEASCFTTPAGSDARFTPGDVVRLTVLGSDGRRLEGETRLPGNFRLRVPAVEVAPGDSTRCVLAPGETLPMAWSPAEGAWAYLGQLSVFGLGDALGDAVNDVPEPLRLSALAITQQDTTLRFPQDFGLFERGSLSPELLRTLQSGFPEGVSARMTLAALDRNYVNAVRGGSFNPSGPVRIASMTGDGTGFFGSLVPLRVDLEVGQPSDGVPACLP